MIGKAKWFSPRKYGGWGLVPNCYQGWLYIFIAALPIIIVKYLPLAQNLKDIFTYSWLAIFIFDLITIIIHLPKDEREASHEAIADRNALWAILLVLIVATVYQSTQGEVDIFIIISLLVGTIVKAITHFFLRHR